MTRAGQQQEKGAPDPQAGGKAPVLRLVQITDTHLSADPGATLAGVNCQDSLKAVLGLVRGLPWRPDVVLCTGDLAQDGSEQAYRRFADLLGAFPQPQRWLPGNHDQWHNLRAVLGADADCLRKTLRVGNWLIVLLDSTVAGEVYGELTDAELAYLDAYLREEAAAHVLVCLHHNPLPVAADWLQRHALRNPEDLFAVLDRHPRVRGVLWGHIHQDFEGERRGVRMLATPSTCVQFHPSNDDFTLDTVEPGYRWLELRADGGIETGVERVKEPGFAVDFSSSGY